MSHVFIRLQILYQGMKFKFSLDEYSYVPVATSPCSSYEYRSYQWLWCTCIQHQVPGKRHVIALTTLLRLRCIMNSYY